MALVIKNAIITGSGRSFRGDVLIEGESIAAAGSAVYASGADVLDAAGKYLFPGGIDLNVSADAYSSGDNDSAAALFGGTTAVCTVCADESGSTCEREMTAGYIDLGLYMPFERADSGCVDDCDIFSLAAKAAERGAPLICRCENSTVTAGLAGMMQKQQKSRPSVWPAVRPAYAEAEAVHRMLTIARAAGAAVYISGVSSAEAMDEIISARRSGQTVYAGTCPHYLILTEDLYHGADASLFTVNPPLRTQRDCERLWRALAQGDLDCVSSDHHALSRADKISSGENIFASFAGMPGIETRLALLFSEGVMKNRITPERFAAVTAGTPAAIAGFGRKGRISAGMDADVILVDPSAKTVISAEKLHQRSGYTPYQGMELNGLVTDVWLRGHHLIANGVMTDSTPRGRFVKRDAGREDDSND